MRAPAETRAYQSGVGDQPRGIPRAAGRRDHGNGTCSNTFRRDNHFLHRNPLPIAQIMRGFFAMREDIEDNLALCLRTLPPAEKVGVLIGISAPVGKKPGRRQAGCPVER
jgi:hypothetical protein